MDLNNLFFLFIYFLKKKCKFFLISLSHLLGIYTNGLQHLKSFSQLLNFHIGHVEFLMTFENFPHLCIQICIKKIKNIWREVFLPQFSDVVDKLLLLSIEAQYQILPLVQLYIHLLIDVLESDVGPAVTMLGTCLTVIFTTKERIFSSTIASCATIFDPIIARAQPLEILDSKASLHLLKFYFWNICCRTLFL